jgi:phosphoribosylanthranilate isomerase
VAVPEVKFCGLTRVVDAARAVECGASFVGVIFAGGPRELAATEARDVLDGARGAARRVGVFGVDFRSRLPQVLAGATLDVVQLHGDPTAADVVDARRLFGGVVWAALRMAGSDVPAHATGLFAEADAVLIDARVTGRLGGTGAALPWASAAPALDRARAGATLVLAGGLTPENVGEAIRALRPDVVDVSSGVESAPGIKDHERMAAFAEAVRGEAA